MGKSGGLFEHGFELDEQFFPDFLMSHFTAFEDHADIDLVAISKEFDGFFGFGAKIVLSDGDVELNLFEFSGFGILSSLALCFLLLEAVFAVIEDFADRWVCLRRDAEEIESIGCGDFVCLARRHFA